MRITSIRIEGFGVLRERTLQLYGPLALCYGANEAGKSTLMGFIRAVLFGFPPRNAPTERYEPHRGGAHGGALTLLDEQGQHILVERYDGSASGRGRSSAGIVKVTLGDGSTGGEELLRTLLGGLSADLFRSLFAFGLTELQELRTLQSEEIGGYLYSAGLGVSGNTIMEAERKLSQQIDGLYKPRGRNQEINKLLKEKEELDRSVRLGKERMADYDRLSEERQRTERRIVRLDQLKRELRAELDQLQAASSARAPWIRLKQIEAELNDLEERADFPDHAVTRYEELEKEVERRTAERSALELQLEQARLALADLEPNEELLRHRTELDDLMERIPFYLDGERSLLELEVEYSHVQQQLDKLLRQLDERWEEATLASFPVSIALREQIRSYRQTFTRLSGEAERLDAEMQRLRLQLSRTEEELEALEQELHVGGAVLSPTNESDPTFFARVKEPDRALQQIAKEYAQWQLLHSEREHLSEREQLAGHHLEQLAEADRNKRRYTGKIGKQLALLTAGAGIASAVWLLMEGEPVIAGTLLIVSEAAAWVIFRATRFRDSARGSRGAYLSVTAITAQEPESNRKNQLDSRIEELERSLSKQVAGFLPPQEEAAAAFEHNRGRRSASSFHGQKENPWATARKWLDSELEAWQQEIDCWRIQQAQHRRQLEKREDSLRLQQSLLRQEEQFKAQSKELEAEIQSHRLEWSRWLGSLHLSDALTPDAALESLQLVEQGHHLLQQKHKLQAKLVSIRDKTAEFKLSAAAYLGAAAAEDPVLSLKQWKKEFSNQLRILQEKDRLEHQVEELLQSLQLLHGQLLRARQRMDSLLQEAKSSDGEQLRLFAAGQERRKKLLEERSFLEGTLEALVGAAQLPSLRILLEESGEEALSRRKQEGDARLAELEEESNQLRELTGRLTGEIEKLELGSEHADRLQLAEEQRASLQRLTDQYAVLSFTAALMKKARDVYERERQPEVLKRASSYFSAMTRGRFTQIMAPFGEQRLVAIRAGGASVDTGFLSRGTAEQLYLAMRFSLAEEHAAKIALPLVMDDILVNFDQERMESTLQVISELSRKHQILLFTCHRHVRDAAAKLIPGYQYVEL